ncbi:Uncharacterized conserved protein [Legionella lansingensis]|uniref:Hemerythrin HHE cation binding domain protein n=1 Tax=Legionella lansingensis TaxID=45067 RepID=A0A0W0VS20_9GAMM|nr:hemerythrin domain-containing protein [Legionella lansingensis]KTD22866.1 Hemerythrin HHE cation binding domain protein [Legionella lansingensis]SNV53687.1 Uncharacterized conserved protein [Legionella lansingensis]
MSIYTYLKNDHKSIEELLKNIEKLDYGHPELRDGLFNKLKTLVILHSKAEEKVFYSSLQRFSLTEDEIKHAMEEHDKIEEMLGRLSDNSLDGTAWEQLFKSMATALRHHIKEEENQIFEDAEQALSTERAQEMEIAMRDEKEKIENNLHLSLR